MTLMERFAALTPEMREKCKEIKTAGELDSFLSQAGIELDAEEKGAALEYILTGALPLSDDELDTVAGGSEGWKYLPQAEKKKFIANWLST